MALFFPTDILKPSQEMWTPRGGSRSSGQTFDGNEVVTASPTQRWQASAVYSVSTSRDAVRAMRRVLSYGRAQTWFVGPCEGVYAPRAPDGAIPLFTLPDGGAAGSVLLTIHRDRDGPMQSGMRFSLDGRMHEIVELTSVDAGGAGNLGIAFRPALRKDYAGGAFADFAHPLSTMRLVADDTGKAMLALSRYGDVTLDWVEAF